MAPTIPPRLLIAQAIASGTPATAALRDFRAAGGSIRTQTWYRLYGQAQLEGINVSAEVDRPLHRRPTGDEIQEMSVKRPGGFLHRVVVLGRDQDGLVISKRVSLKVDQLMSRRRAIETAISKIRDALDRYGITPLTGFHVGAYQLVE